MECSTRMVFIGFSLVVLLFMHLTMQNLSRVKSSCLVGHEKTLSNLEEFRDSLLESDLLVSFVDKTDLARLERERREAEIRVTKLIRQLKTVQAELTALKMTIMNGSASRVKDGGEVKITPVSIPPAPSTSCHEMQRQFDSNRDAIYSARDQMKVLRERMLKHCDTRRKPRMN